MSQMIDTMVLVYALAHRPSATTPPGPLTRLREASYALVSRMKPIRFSAVSWMEVLRTTRDSDYVTIASLLRHIDILPVDTAIAARAAELIKIRGSSGSFCDGCLHIRKGVNACPKCSRNYSPKHALNDALILATAEKTERVTTLYTFDGGLIELGKHAEGCVVLRPGHPHGPLFDPNSNPKFGSTANGAVAQPPADALAAVAAGVQTTS